MKVKVLFFASLREQLGTAAARSSSCRRTSRPSARCASICARAAARGRACSRRTGRVRAAVNQDMVQAAATLKAGDEVAFFPPVTGG